MDNNPTYNSKDLLKKYLAKTLSSAEKELFEKQFGADDFEKEALEGFEGLDNSDIALSMLNHVENEIALKTDLKQEKEFRLPIMRIASIAAALLVLFGIGFFVTQALKTNETIVAKNEAPINQELEKPQSEKVLFPTDSLDLFNDTCNQQASERPNLTLPKIINKEENESLDNVSAKESIPNQKNPKIAEPSIKLTDDETAVASNVKPMADMQKTSASPNEDINFSNIGSDFKEESTEYTTTTTAAGNNLNHFQVGKSAYDTKNYNQAISYFEESVSNGKNVTESEYYIGLSNYNLNKHNKALKNFDTVINSTSPLKYNAQWYKSLILIEKGDESGAKTLLQNLANGNSGFKNQAQDKLNSLK